MGWTRLLVWISTRKNERRSASGNDEHGDGTQNGYGFLSLRCDVGRLGMHDCFSSGVGHLGRGEQRQAEQDQKNAENPRPERFCPLHISYGSVYSRI